METIIALLLTPWIFISLLVLGFIIQSIAIETEHFGFGVFMLVICVYLIHLNYNLIDYVTHNVGTTILYVIGYIIIGIGWSMLKWYIKLNDKISLIRAAKSTYRGYSGTSSLKGNELETAKFNHYMEHISSNVDGFLYRGGLPKTEADFEKQLANWLPSVTKHKSQIIAWMTLWPASAVATLFNNPIRRFFTWIYNHISGVYQSISNSLISSVVKTLK